MNIIHIVIILFLIVSSLIGCKSRDHKESDISQIDTLSVSTENQIVQNSSELFVKGHYVINNSVAFSNGIMSSKYGLLYKGITFIDTVDLYFGAQLIGEDTVLYRPVYTLGYDDDEGFTFDWRKFTLFNGSRKTVLSDFLPYIDDYYSSPSIIDNKLYYWGLGLSSKEYHNRIIAMRYSFNSNHIDSSFLEEYSLETDNSSHLRIPLVEDGNIIYERPGHKWIISKINFSILSSRSTH